MGSVQYNASMSRLLYLLAAALLLGGCDGPESQDHAAVSFDPAVVQADVQRIHEAIYGDELDVETILNLTHPPIIEAMGGRDKARTALADSLSGIRDTGLGVESFEFSGDPVFASSQDLEFVVVPTKTVFRAGDRRAESGNFQFGVRQKGQSQWRYIEGSRVNSQTLAQVFPGIPPDLILPKTYRRPIEE